MTEKQQKARKVSLPSFALIGSSLATFLAAASCGVTVVPTSEAKQEIEKKVQEKLKKELEKVDARVKTLEEDKEAKEEEQHTKRQQSEARIVATFASESEPDSGTTFYNATRNFEIAGNLVRESSVSFANLQRAKEEFQRARDLYKEIMFLEEQAEEEQRTIEEKLQEYRLARDNNWSFTSEVFLYLLTFKFIWGAFSQTGYAPTTFSSSQKAALEEQKAKSQTAVKEINHKIFLTTRSFNNSLQRLERDLEAAFDSAVTIAEQVAIKDLKKIVKQLFKKYTEARKSHRDSFRVFRETLLAALNTPDVTSEVKAKMYRLLAEKNKLQRLIDRNVPLSVLHFFSSDKALPFTDSRVLARFQTFVFRWANMRTAVKKLKLAKEVFESEQTAVLDGFVRLFRTTQSRYSALETAREIREKAKEAAEGKFGGLRAETSPKTIQKEVEEGRALLNTKKQILETLLKAQDESESILSILAQKTALIQERRALTSLEEIKAEEVALQQQGTGSALREFALYALGFKWLYASVYTLFYGMWKSEGKFDAFKPAKMSTEAETEQSALLEQTLSKKEELTKEIERLETDLMQEKTKLTQTLETLFELRDADVNQTTKEAAFDPRFRMTLQNIRVQLYEAIARVEKAQKEFAIAEARWVKHLRANSTSPNSQVFDFEFEPSYDALSTEAVSPHLAHFLTQFVSETYRVSTSSDSVKKSYRALQLSTFEREFLAAQYSFAQARVFLEDKIKFFKDNFRALLLSVRGEAETQLTKQRLIEQELLINSARQAAIEENPTPITETTVPAEERTKTQQSE